VIKWKIKIDAMYVDIIYFTHINQMTMNVVSVGGNMYKGTRQTTLDEFGFEFYGVPKEIIWSARELLRIKVKEEE